MRNPFHLLDISELDEDAFQPRGRMGGMRLYGGGKGGGSAPAPDPQIGAAALENVKLGKEWLGFAKEQFAVGNDRQRKTDELNQKVITQQLGLQDRANMWAQEDRARTTGVFQPLEDKFVKTAQEFDTPEKQAEAAATAKADVMAAADQAGQIRARQMAASGVSPDSGRAEALQRSGDIATALGSADAQNKAREMVKTKGLALTADAINMGKGLASSTASSAGIGLNAGNAAVGNNQSGNNNFYANNGVMTSGFGGAMQGNSSGAGILSNLYNGQLSAWNSQQQANSASAAGMGQLVGTLGSAAILASDIKAKEDLVQIGTIHGIPLYEYSYKPEYRDQWGHGRHVGVLAQDVEKVMPDAVHEHKDGYKMVDYSKVVRHVV